MGVGRRLETVYYQSWLKEHRRENELKLTANNFSFKKAELGFGVKDEIVVKQDKADKTQCLVCKRYYEACSCYLNRKRERNHEEKMEEEGNLAGEGKVKLEDGDNGIFPTEQRNFPNQKGIDERANILKNKVKEHPLDASENRSGSSKNQARLEEKSRISSHCELNKIEVEKDLDDKTITRSMLRCRSQNHRPEPEERTQFGRKTSKTKTILVEERQQEKQRVVTDSSDDWDWEAVSYRPGMEKIEEGAKASDVAENMDVGNESSATRKRKEIKNCYVMFGCDRNNPNSRVDSKSRKSILGEVGVICGSKEGSSTPMETSLTTCGYGEDVGEGGSDTGQCREHVVEDMDG